MLKKVIEFIKIYRNLIDQKEFAEKRIRQIIDWSWMSKDMGIIDQKTHTEIYSFAIDALIELDK